MSLTSIFLSAITILELELGALSIGGRDDAQGMVLRAWVDEQVLPGFSGRILPVDATVGSRAARLRLHDPPSKCSAVIAATALGHGFTVVTCNVTGFEPFGVRTLNPWD